MTKHAYFSKLKYRFKIAFVFCLLKLDAFLKQKYNEMKSESDNILISTILQDTPKSIREVTERGWLFKSVI